MGLSTGDFNFLWSQWLKHHSLKHLSWLYLYWSTKRLKILGPILENFRSDYKFSFYAVGCMFTTSCFESTCDACIYTGLHHPLDQTEGVWLSPICAFGTSFSGSQTSDRRTARVLIRTLLGPSTCTAHSFPGVGDGVILSWKYTCVHKRDRINFSILDSWGPSIGSPRPERFKSLGLRISDAWNWRDRSLMGREATAVLWLWPKSDHLRLHMHSGYLGLSAAESDLVGRWSRSCAIFRHLPSDVDSAGQGSQLRGRTLKGT